MQIRCATFKTSEYRRFFFLSFACPYSGEWMCRCCARWINAFSFSGKIKTREHTIETKTSRTFSLNHKIYSSDFDCCCEQTHALRLVHINTHHAWLRFGWDRRHRDHGAMVCRWCLVIFVCCFAEETRHRRRVLTIHETISPQSSSLYGACFLLNDYY